MPTPRRGGVGEFAQEHKMPRRWSKPSFRFGFELERRGRTSIQPEVDATKAALATISALDVMALSHVEDGFHDDRQLAKKGRLAHRRQVARLRYLLIELPRFRAGKVGVGIGREILLSKMSDRVVPWCWSALLRCANERAEQGDGVANSLKFGVCHTPLTTSATSHDVRALRRTRQDVPDVNDHGVRGTGKSLCEPLDQGACRA